MQLEVGNIVEGKVTGITKFGVFVELEKDVTGMVHISEVAATYVKEITDFIKMGDMVKVKILKVSDDGKISLSIKRAVEGYQEERPRRQGGGQYQKRQPRQNQGNRSGDQYAASKNYEWTPKPQGEMSFEDMMSKFKQSSDEKMSDLRRIMDNKRGSSRRGGPRGQ